MLPCPSTNPIVLRNTYISGFVIQTAVAKHSTEVLDAGLARIVLVLIELLLDQPHVHGALDDLKVVLHTHRQDNVTPRYH